MMKIAHHAGTVAQQCGSGKAVDDSKPRTDVLPHAVVSGAHVRESALQTLPCWPQRRQKKKAQARAGMDHTGCGMMPGVNI